MNNIVELLIKNNKKISLMESCTGGAITNYITNIPNASKVIEFSAVTYSNNYKIKMGVNKELIDKYSVYSMEVADNMAKTISEYTDSNYGVGITGKLKRIDENNPYGDDDLVYLSIYDNDNNKYFHEKIKLKYDTRIDNKEQIINIFVEKIQRLLR